MATPKKTTPKKDVMEIIKNDVPDAPQDEISTIEQDVEKKEPSIVDGVYTEYGVELSSGVTIPEMHVVVDPDRFPMDFDRLMDRGRVDLAMLLLLSDQTMYILRTIGANRKMVRDEVIPVIQRGLEMSREN